MPTKDAALDAAIALRVMLHLHANLQQKPDQEQSGAVRAFESACPVLGSDRLPTLRQLTLILDLIQCNASDEHVGVTLIILEKALRACDELLLSASNWQLLVTTAFLLASKQLDDEPMNLSDIRRLCILYEHRERGERPSSRSSAAICVSSQHAAAEIAFCSLCGWATFVSPAHLSKYQHGLSLAATIIDDLHSPVLSADDHAYLLARRPSIAGVRRATSIAVRASPQLQCEVEEESEEEEHAAKVARLSDEGSQMSVLAGAKMQIDEADDKVKDVDDELMKLVADDFADRAIDLEGGGSSIDSDTRDSPKSEDSFHASIVTTPRTVAPKPRREVRANQPPTASAGSSAAASNQFTTTALTSTAAGYALASRTAHICGKTPHPSPGCVLVRRSRPIGRSPLGQRASLPTCLTKSSLATCVGMITNQQDYLPEDLQPWVRRNKRGRGSMGAMAPQHRANYMR